MKKKRNRNKDNFDYGWAGFIDSSLAKKGRFCLVVTAHWIAVLANWIPPPAQYRCKLPQAMVYLQNGLGISAIQCGLYFILPGILFIGSSVAASKLIIRFGKRVLQIGAVIMGAAFFLQMGLWKPGTSALLIVSLMSMWGIGNGLVLPSLMNLALKSVPPEYAGAAAGVYSTFQQTASALGVSIIGGVFFYFSRLGWQTAYHAGILLILFCVLLVSFMLYLLPDGRSAKRPGLVVQAN